MTFHQNASAAGPASIGPFPIFDESRDGLAQRPIPAGSRDDLRGRTRVAIWTIMTARAYVGGLRDSP